jgi:hypothetical protein
MSVNTPENFDFNSARQQFIDAHTVAGEIYDQNNRAERIEQDLDDLDFQALTWQGLAAEQSQTINQLRQISAEAPYHELGQLYIKALDDEARLAAEIDSERLKLDSEQVRLDELAQRAAKLAPLIREEALKIAEAKKAELSNDRIDNLGAQAAMLADARGKIENLYSTAGFWPVPQVETITAAASEVQELIFDEIPVEPETQDHEQSERLERYRNYHIDAPEASKYIAFYFTEHPGQVVSVKALIDFIYSRNVIEENDSNKMRSRITTMLGPKVQGPRIQAMLAEDGLILQYGWRTIKKVDTSTNQTISNTTERIYRALPLDAVLADHLEPEFVEFDNGEQKETDTIIWNINAPELEAAAINEEMIEPSIPVVVAEVEVPAMAQIEPEVAEADVLTTPTSPSVGEIIKRPFKKESKLKGFDQAVEEAIELLESDGLIQAEPLPHKIVASKSSSRILGTKEAIDRMIKAGILPKSMSKTENIFLSAADIVAMRLLNTHIDVLGKNNRKLQDEALRIIKAKVSRRLELAAAES